MDISLGAMTSSLPFVGQVYQKVMLPDTPGQFYAVHPAVVLGDEVEAGLANILVDANQTRYVVVYGGNASAGDYLICHWASNRWVADRMYSFSGQIISIPGCPCTNIPPTLQMTSSDTTANNGLFQSTSLVYGPTPPEFAPLALGASCYLSPSYFTDTSTNDSFRYFFGCYSGFYIITRVFAVSIFGSPYKDTILYKWFAGFPGNTCSPFSMTNGQIYAGGDPSSVVTITG